MFKSRKQPAAKFAAEDRRLRLAFWISLAIALTVFAGINALGRRDLPTEPMEHIAVLRAAGLHEEAEQIYESLLSSRPSDPQLVHEHITNHFLIASNTGVQTDSGIETIYRRLAGDPRTADTGSYGMGLVRSHQKNYQDALAYFQRIGNQRMKYLNNSMGYVYLQMGELDQAETCFRSEIDLGGNLQGAVANLAQILFRTGQLDKLLALVRDARTRPYIGYSERRLLAFQRFNLLGYLRLTFLSQLAQIHPAGALATLLICALWFFYLWRIDVFEQEPVGLCMLTVGFGGLSALGTTVLTDTSLALHPMTMNGQFANDLIFSFVHIGLIEEISKLLPVLFVGRFFKVVNEPVDLVIYGSLSALGFATMENALYFSRFGLDIAFGRFLISTIMHMAMTSLVCSAWAWARFSRGARPFPAIIASLAAAACVHGLFDFFILGPDKELSRLAFFVFYAMALFYGWTIHRCLNQSPFFKDALSSSSRLENISLIATASIAVFAAAYLYDHFRFSTQIANERLGWGMIGSLVNFSVVVGALGRFTVLRKARTLRLTHL